MQLFGKEMGKVGGTDTQGVGNGIEGDFLAGMVGDVAHDPVSKILLGIIVNGVIGEAVENTGEKHVQIGDTERQVVFHVQIPQAGDGVTGA